MNKTLIPVFLLIFYRQTALCSFYRNWTSTAKSNFKKGKEIYNSILNNIRENENDCLSLVSIDKHISDSSPVDFEYIEKSQDPYPCLTQINKKGEKFDIDMDSDSLKGMSYSKIISEAGCWRYVINEINSLDIASCDFKGDASRSLIALSKTKCHFLRANRKFPTKSQGCVLDPSSLTVEELNTFLNSNPDAESVKSKGKKRGMDGKAKGAKSSKNGEEETNKDQTEEEMNQGRVEYLVNPCSLDYKGQECEKVKRRIVSHCTNPNVMSEAAFQMYHSDLNHIDNICFYLQSGEWNRRTETNINKLTDSAAYMIDVYNTVKDQFELLNSKQSEQLNKAENLTVWIDSIKTDLGTVLLVITTIKEYQRKILDFITNFKTYCTYLIFTILGIIATSFEFAANARLKVIIAIIISCLLEIIVQRVFNGWLDIDISQYLSPEAQEYMLKSIRIGMALYITFEWIHSFIWYKPAWKVMLREVNELKKVIANPVIYIPGGSTGEYKEVTYTFDEFVEKFGDDESEYTYESDDTTSDYDSEEDDEELGSDSEGIVDEYLESVPQLSREETLDSII